ncbi:MAG: porin [Gammaproteobacteria bacterium]|nr:porin [Gammaproteobacteria bacterium]MDH5730920.1 porin [Gammaproteobacteria bacterium]
MESKFSARKMVIVAACGFIAATTVQAEALKVYGKIHVSGDMINYANSSDMVVSSNSSRIGFKGDKELKHGLKAVWKMESEVDVTAEGFSVGDGKSTGLKARNQYLGLQHSAGTVLLGYHDTPFKTMGGMAGVFHDTIGERRGVLGAGNGNNKMNIRARNAVMYVSPKIAGLEVRAMASTGNDTSSSDDNNGVMSFSALYKTKMFYVGAAYEDQSKLSATEATGMRFQGGVTFGSTSINAIYEALNSDTKDEFTRNAYGGSLKHKIGDLALKAQIFMLDAYKDQVDSGAMLYAVGADYKLDKDFTLYAMFAGVNNQDNAKVVLAGSGHGEKYSPVATGDDLTGISAGMSYKF